MVERAVSPLEAWFAGSVVVDQNGQPLVCYHGTRADFRQFTKGDIGFHFGTKDAAMARLADTGSADGKLMEVYLRITNPLDMYDRPEWTDEWIYECLDPTGIMCLDPFLTEEQYDSYLDQGTPALEVIRRHGYDGIRYRNDNEDAGSISWIAFDANQIKSVEATSFSDSQDIYEAD